MRTQWTRKKLARLAVWAFVLHAVWEYAQCALFFSMWDLGFWKGAAWMGAALACDVLISLGVVLGAGRLAPLDPPGAKGWALLLGLGLLAGLLVEAVARGLALWDYGPAMPTFKIWNTEIGLGPLLQMTLLPALSWHATWRAKGRRTP